MNGRIVIVTTLILAALVLFLLGLAAWLRRATGKSAVFLAICMWAVAIYSFGYGMELLSNSLSQAEFWVRFEHWGIQLIAPTWLLFALSVSGYEKRIKPVFIIALGVIPLYLFLTAQTLGWLNLAHHNPRMILSGPFPMFTYDRNLWNYIAVGYYSLCIATSTVVFAIALFKSVPAVKKNALIYLLGSLPAWVGLVLHNLGLSGNIDFTPLFLGISGLFFVYGFTKLRMLEIIPLARDVIFENMSTGVLILDREDRIIDFNSALHEIFPNITKKTIGASVYRTFPDDPSLLQLVRGAEVGRIELRFDSGNECSYYRASSTNIYDRRNHLIGKIVNFYEYTKEKQLLEQLERLAAHDGLTGAYNRQQFMTMAEKEVKRHDRYGGNLSMIMLDLDKFKKVNDTYGHGAGDLTLKTLTKTFSRMIRQSDILARIGGEEFIILLPETSIEAAQSLAERLRNTLSSKIINFDNQSFSVSASFGISGMNTEMNMDLQDLYRLADRALYRAKGMGGSTVCVNIPSQMEKSMST
jgi:diguanylate cyclase (GGDEF)-like protein